MAALRAHRAAHRAPRARFRPLRAERPCRLANRVLSVPGRVQVLCVARSARLASTAARHRRHRMCTAKPAFLATTRPLRVPARARCASPVAGTTATGEPLPASRARKVEPIARWQVRALKHASSAVQANSRLRQGDVLVLSASKAVSRTARDHRAANPARLVVSLEVAAAQSPVIVSLVPLDRSRIPWAHTCASFVPLVVLPKPKVLTMSSPASTALLGATPMKRAYPSARPAQRVVSVRTVIWGLTIRMHTVSSAQRANTSKQTG